MAQAHNFTLTSTSAMVQIPENYVDRVFALAPWETQLLTAVGIDSLPSPCTQPVYKYLDTQDRPARTTLNGGIDNSTQTIVLSDAVCAAGEVIQVDEETILLGTTSDNLTFSTSTRSHGSTSAAAHLTLAPVVSLGKPRAEGADAASTGDRVLEPNTITNYTQIFSKTIVVSGTASVVDRYGGTGNEMSTQEMFQLKVLKKELQNSFIWNKAVAAVTTGTAGEMQGIYEHIRTNSATDLSDASATHDNLEDVVEVSADYGGVMNVVACGLYPARVFNSWGQAYVTHPTDPMDPVNMTYGTNVSRLHIGGQVLNILVCPDLHTHIFCLDTTRIGVGPLQGRAFFKKPLDPGGDKEKSMVIGEYTCCVPNDRAHAILTSVKFT
jgi:hypothetical protein